MQYNEIYNICQPAIDWLKEHYPHNHKIVIDTNGAELIEYGKLIALDRDLKSPMFQKPCVPKEHEKEIQEILGIDASKIQDDVHRFGIDMLKKLFNYENQPDPKRMIMGYRKMVNQENNVISHPSHYCDGRKYEPRKVIADWKLNFNLGNAVKYLSRAGRKGSKVEDLRKAVQYIEFEIEDIENESDKYKN